jgi:indolepyruvate ferredoxin oxidoreductase beta subunit
MDNFKLVIAGVGGQGTLLASKLIAQASINVELPVKIGETYGMAQRGGPVMGHIQIGKAIESPQIRPGRADVLIGFEIGEGVRRGVTYLKKDGLALLNTRKFPPVEVISGIMDYPKEESLISLLNDVTSKIVKFDATLLAEKAGNAISTNMVMLGAIVESCELPFSKEVMLDTIRNNVRTTFLETNLIAFKLGQEAYRNSI